MNRQSAMGEQDLKDHDWTPEKIHFTVDDGVQYNLMDYVGKQCLKAGELLYLPEKYSVDMSKDDAFNETKRGQLLRALKIAASDAGFALVCKGWDKDKERMEFKCQRYRPRGRQEKQDKQRIVHHNPTTAYRSKMPLWIPSHLG
jgi:hypothetical protein